MGEVRVLVGTAAFDASVEFYGGVLGFPVTVQWGADGTQGRGAIFAATGDARIEVLEGRATPSGLTVSVQVDDVETVAGRLGPHLVEPPTLQPWGHRSCTADDPNGVRLVFFQVVGDDPAA